MADLVEEFDDDISVTIKPSPSANGSLEVQVVDGPLLHSKLGGAGYVDSQEKMDKIFEGVKALL